MPAILWSAIAFRWTVSVRRARMPPWIEGCRVFTRPSMISGKPVWSLTSTTFSPASRNAFAEPPVDRISMPWPASARPSSTRPALSDTEISARSIFARSGVGEGTYWGAADMAALLALFDLAQKGPLLGQNEAAVLGALEIGGTLGIGAQAGAIGLVSGEAVEGNQRHGDVVGTFVRHPVAQEIAPHARDDIQPALGVGLELCALEGVELVADEHGHSHGSLLALGRPSSRGGLAPCFGDA